MAIGNGITFIGRMVREPEIRHINENTQVCDFTLVRDDVVKGEKKPLFFDFVAFGKQAELIVKYVGKGREVAVSARITQSQWVDNHDQKRTNFKGMVESINLISFKSDDDDNKEKPNRPVKSSVDAEKEFVPPANVEDDDDEDNTPF